MATPANTPPAVPPSRGDKIGKTRPNAMASLANTPPAVPPSRGDKIGKTRPNAMAAPANTPLGFAGPPVEGGESGLVV